LEVSWQPSSDFVLIFIIAGRNLFPVSGYLHLVWKLFAPALQNTCPVVFENCKFIRTVTLSESNYTTFNVSIQRGSGNFEIMEDNTLVAKGRILSVENMNDDTGVPDFDEGVAANVLQSDEIYRELHLRGYSYRSVN
jgi:fatty acid synthase